MGEKLRFGLEVAKVIAKAKALEFTEFKHPNLGVSLYNIDFSFVFNFPDLLRKLIDLMSELIEEKIELKAVDYIGGILTKGVVLSSILAYKFNKPTVIFNSRGLEVYGGVGSGSRILIVDDVIMTGNTLRRCVKRVKESIGGDVRDVAVILDRMCGGRVKLEREGVKVHALTNIAEVARALLSIGELDRGQYEVIMSEIGS